MGAILVIVLLGLLLLGDLWKWPPGKRRYHRNPPARTSAPKSAPKVVEATPDPESMDRYLTAAVLAGMIDKTHYRTRMAELAATTGLYVRDSAPSGVTDPRLRAAIGLARQGIEADDLVRLLGITHADAVRVVITARETR